MKKILLFLAILAIAICSGCQSPQEEDGVSPLPQNRPTAKEMRMGSGLSLNY